MAGGPIHPHSAIPTTDEVFPNVHVSAGANSKEEQGLGVAGSLGADSIWRMRFQMPPTLPVGTGKLRLLALASATTGNAKLDVKWLSVAVGEDPAGTVPSAEGIVTITWATVDVYVEHKETLDVDTIIAGEEIVVDLTFLTTLWTLVPVSTWIPTIIWE